MVTAARAVVGFAGGLRGKHKVQKSVDVQGYPRHARLHDVEYRSGPNLIRQHPPKLSAAGVGTRSGRRAGCGRSACPVR